MSIKGLIIFGDSILAGTGSTDRDKGCAKIIKSSLFVPVSLRARNWDTSQGGVERIEQDVLYQKQFSHVLLLFGNNDSWLIGPGISKIPLKTFAANMKRMIALIQSNRQIPIVCNLQPIEPERLFSNNKELIPLFSGLQVDPKLYHGSYSNMIESVCKSTYTEMVDIRAAFEKNLNTTTIGPDGIHPNDYGHRIIAEIVLKKLIEIDPKAAALKRKTTAINL